MKDDEDGSQRSLLPRDYDDPAGAFHFEALRAGHYAVAVVVPRRPISGQWIDVRPGEETTVQFRLETGVSLTGVVKDADGVAPVAGARVMAAANGWWADHLTLPTPYSAWSAADGSFRIEGLGPARYHLYIYRSDFAPKEKTVEVRAGEDPAPLEIALRRSGRHEGRPVNFTKRKAISTSILLRRLDEPGKEPERHSITGRSEDFALEGIRPGRYEVQLHEEVLGPRVAPDATAFK